MSQSSSSSGGVGFASLLAFLMLSFVFVGCHKKELDQCQLNLDGQKQVNDVLSSKAKDCPVCLPCALEDCATKVPKMSSDDVCDYYKSLYSKALHQYRRELIKCKSRQPLENH